LTREIALDRSKVTVNEVRGRRIQLALPARSRAPRVGQSGA